MQWQTSMIDEWILDKESLIGLLEELLEGNCIVHLSRPSRGLEQFSIYIQEGDDEEADNT